jgi:hypothetical protein
LQPVHQLAARQQFFIENERKRLRHALRVMENGKNAKPFWPVWPVWALQFFYKPLTCP